ncbi:MAG: FixH family protein [Azoarcus sp.]|jgi:hypothetical protein|nr:FixH family protein [Azoarcus sp.]
MPTLLSRSFSAIAALLICCAVFSSAHAASKEIVAKLDALPAPVIANQFYECSLSLTNTEGVGIPGLHLQIRGRMPEHAHGLPTAPQITDEGQGRYRIKGLSFNMPGRWVIEIVRDDKPVLRQELMVQF